MLATHGSVAKLKAAQWAFEGKWDGYRLLFDADHGDATLRSRSGRDMTAEYPQLHSLAAELADHRVILDGEVVALDESGVPSFGEMQNRARATRIEYWAFDLLYLDGRSLLNVKYRDRRALLEMLAKGTNLIVPEQISGDGADALEYSGQRRWEGVVAKKWDSTYQPGHRSSAWIKDKNWFTQEIVIGGWRQGEGGRSSGIGALLMGIPGDGGLHFVGPGGHRVHAEGTRQAQADTRAAAHRRVPVQRTAHRPRRQELTYVGRSWSARSGSASGRGTVGCGSRVGGGCVRTSHPRKSCGNRSHAVSLGDRPLRPWRGARR